MKYIRTKEGIFDTSKGIYTPSIKMWAIGTETIYEKDIIAQADTIDELCDEFVLYDNRLKNYGVFDKRVIDYEWLKKHIDIYKGIPIYGAIYTDKGLIYVAKMDDKGDLELI